MFYQALSARPESARRGDGASLEHANNVASAYRLQLHRVCRSLFTTVATVDTSRFGKAPLAHRIVKNSRVTPVSLRPCLVVDSFLAFLCGLVLSVHAFLGVDSFLVSTLSWLWTHSCWTVGQTAESLLSLVAVATEQLAHAPVDGSGDTGPGGVDYALHLRCLRDEVAAIAAEASSVASSTTLLAAPPPQPSPMTAAVETALRAEVTRLSRELVEAKEDLLRDEGTPMCDTDHWTLITTHNRLHVHVLPWCT